MKTFKEQIVYDSNQARHDKRYWKKCGNVALEHYYHGIMMGCRYMWRHLQYREQLPHLYPDAIVKASNG